jgi:hypothetical protein
MAKDRELEELKALRRKSLDKVEAERDIPALSGKADGTLQYPGYANKIYARRKDTRQEVVVWSVMVSAPNLPIILRYDRVGQLYVDRVDVPPATLAFQQNAAVAGQPAINPATSNVLVDAAHIVPGGAFAAEEGGLYVRVPAFRHHGGYWTGETPILLTPTATASKKSYAMFGVNRFTNASTTALTTDRALGFPMLPTECDSTILANPAIDWRGAAELANGDTSINAAKIIPLGPWRSPVMVGADGSNAGISGSVPKPAAADNVKFLRGDATWQSIAASALPAFGAGVIKTLSSDVATLGSDRSILLAAQSGTSDDCIEVSGLAVGEEAWLFADTGDTITLKYNNGGATDKFIFYNGADLVLSGNTGLKVFKKAAGVVVNSLDKDTGGSSLTYDDVFLTGDVTLTNANTYYDIFSLSLGAGTWLISASMIYNYTGGTSQAEAKLWDGSTAYAAVQTVKAITGDNPTQFTIPPVVVVLGSTTTVKVSAASQGAGALILTTPSANNTGLTNLGGYMTAVQIA